MVRAFMSASSIFWYVATAVTTPAATPMATVRPSKSTDEVGASALYEDDDPREFLHEKARRIAAKVDELLEQHR